MIKVNFLNFKVLIKLMIDLIKFNDKKRVGWGWRYNEKIWFLLNNWLKNKKIKIV